MRKLNRTKLRLDVDELKVEAFATLDSLEARGTVQGRNDSMTCPVTGPCGPWSDCTCHGATCAGGDGLCQVSAFGC
jgi:hypothetical protein